MATKKRKPITVVIEKRAGQSVRVVKKTISTKRKAKAGKKK